MRIALIGSAPSSTLLAPFGDPSWTIWGCSPGASQVIKRLDAFFELHPYDPADPTFYPDYVEWLKKQTCPVYMPTRDEMFPTSVRYPAEEMIDKFGRNFFTSSLAWMCALAIATIENAPPSSVVTVENGQPVVTPEPHEIGFWGVDMAASEEYGHQKPGCLYFIEKARERGIKVTVPPQSDLDQPIPLYGIGELDPHRIKLNIRMRELQGKIAEADANVARAKSEFENAMRSLSYYTGAAEDCQYHLNTWTGNHYEPSRRDRREAGGDAGGQEGGTGQDIGTLGQADALRPARGTAGESIQLESGHSPLRGAGWRGENGAADRPLVTGASIVDHLPEGIVPD